MSFLALRALEKRYPDGFLAVKGIDLAIERGEFIVLLGPSGCGKTTTLRMVAGLEIATGGTIQLAGAEVTTLRPARRDVGFVFQFYALYPHLRVRDNIAFPLAGLPRAERASAVERVVAQLGLADLLDRYPRQLSGGDQQRVALARALVRTPALWLMDEPLGTLDGERRTQLREFIRAQQRAMGVTTLYVTHDQEEAMTLADRVVVMDAGRIRQVGTPEAVYEEPADLFVADFVGSPGMNRLAGEIIAGAFQPAGGAPPIPLVRAVRPGAAVLGVRSEYVLADDAAPLRGTVVLDEYLGAWRNVHLDTPAGRVVMRAAPDRRHRPGETLGLRFAPEHTLLFDAANGMRV